MPSRVLLISVNTYASPYPVYPLGLAHVAAALERAGHVTCVLDMGRDKQRLESEIAAFRPEVVGLSLRNIDDVDIEKRRFFVPDLVEAVRRVKAATGVPVVIGGSAFSLFPEQILELSGADYGVKGEGERALPALVSALASGGDPRGIPGLVRRQGGAVTVNAPSACLPADIPLAAHPPELLAHYRQQSSMISVQTQRGCAFRCCYCTYPLIEGSRVRFRAAADVGEEAARLKAQGIRYFFVVDSVFNTSRDHVVAVCEEMIRRDLGMHWCCFLRPAGLDGELMDLMARAGLQHVEFGSDSFCDEVLSAYGKDFAFADILQASDLARARRIRYAHFLIAGGPGETEATLREGFANSRKLQRTVIFPFVGMRLYPGTRLFEIAVREEMVDPDARLLEPFYYVAPGLGEKRVRDLLAEFTAQAGNWVVGDLPPELARIARQLRAKGVEGPLWEFLIR